MDTHVAASAEGFIERLEVLDRGHQGTSGTQSGGREPYASVPMRDVFALAKEFIDMSPAEIERLLDRPEHMARVGAVSVMDWQARRRSTTAQRRRELYELYVRRHDRIDDWDLVDRSAPTSSAGTSTTSPATSSTHSPDRRASGNDGPPS